MRLTQIKLSGFKSFVDMTVIPTPGDMVGIVGPNGCGKSNIIDAVRWVLGESRASELRGSSMQDVIFNGSGERKAAGRASVELIFDNSLGRAAGQWSSYAEISVRRVLTRDGSSSYFINNQQVRRRDIYDIFMGTGLGARGYAIIGQGMINRLIEARPDELRVYLEEAAGVSRYKERRRETENRLHDTRENLIRLEDIIRELDAQLEKLHEQSVIAKKYQSLQAEGELKQNALWLLREQAAIISQKKLADEYAQQQLVLENSMTDLRAVQSQLEQKRSQNYDLNQATHDAQGKFFETSSVVSRYEAEIKHISDARGRLQARRNQLQVQIQQWQDQYQHAVESISDLELQLESANQEANLLQEQALSAQAGLPELDNELHDLRAERERLRQQLSRDEQKLALARQKLSDSSRQLQTIADKFSRLNSEQDQITVPDTSLIDDLQSEFEIAQAKTEQAQDELLDCESKLAEQNTVLEQCLVQKRQQQQQYDKLIAREQALSQLQSEIRSKDQLQDWLANNDMTDLSQLWQEIQVANDWVLAVESILHERMQAMPTPSLTSLKGCLSNTPPVKMAFYVSNKTAQFNQAEQDKTCLLAHIHTNNSDIQAALNYWLRNVYVAADIDAAIEIAVKHDCLVVLPQGHVIDQYGIRLFAGGGEQSGLLARQQEIDELHKAIKAGEIVLNQFDKEHQNALTDKTAIENKLYLQRQQIGTLLRNEHNCQINLNNAKQQFNSASQQQQRLAAELNELQANHQDLSQQSELAQAETERFTESVTVFEDQVLALDTQINELANQVQSARTNSYEQEKQAQNAKFNVRSLDNRLAELRRNQQLAQDQIQTSSDELENLQGELFELDETTAKYNLQQSLADKLQAENDLRAARVAQEKVEAELRTIDQKRLQIEQALEPQRAKITDLQLKEQASRLNIEQYAAQLDEKQVDRLALESRVKQENWQNITWLQAEVQAVNRKINTLGAVNLAALDELAKANERKQFLAAQQSDLQTAIDTLESAIRKIDNETRVLLQQTFDKVNQNFGELFPRLFGGGKASLTMTGDEVLDAGVQVMAQPPGKRNSTINLLSGGEKALTAIALVFAFFKLNPAPFCLLDEVDAPLDDANTERYANLVRSMSSQTQFVFISHNKIAMQMAKQLIGVTMQEQGVSRIVAVDMDAALQLALPTA